MNDLPKNATIPYIQRKLKASYEDAKKIFEDLAEINRLESLKCIIMQKS